MPKKIDVDMEKFWASYNEGLSERGIGRALGITLKIVQRVFREQKLSPRPKVKDLKGKKIGKLFIKERDGFNNHCTVIWKCICDCGKITHVLSSNLINGSTISCGCATEDFYGKPKRIYKAYQDISGQYFYSICNGAERRNLKVSVSIEDLWELYLKQNRKCSLSGLPINFGSKKTKQTASVDRIDSKKDYSIDNIQIVHKALNRMKQEFTQTEFIEYCKLVAKTWENNESVST